MSQLIDETGKKYGRWTVVKRVSNSKTGDAKWLCKCECGTEKIVRGRILRSGESKSCGCLQKIAFGMANMRKLIRNYKNSAKIKGYSYELTEEQFVELTQKDCFYCGAKPNGVIKTKWHNGKYIYNGIDRIDNTRGYVIDNVVPCCKICNYAKKARTIQEYEDWIRQSYNNMFDKKGSDYRG